MKRLIAITLTLMLCAVAAHTQTPAPLAINAVRKHVPHPKAPRHTGAWEIVGKGFGAKPGRLLVNLKPVTAHDWSDTRILMDAPPADCDITIQTAAGQFYTTMHRRAAK